jgi:hypothetical protein
MVEFLHIAIDLFLLVSFTLVWWELRKQRLEAKEATRPRYDRKSRKYLDKTMPLKQVWK